MSTSSAQDISSITFVDNLDTITLTSSTGSSSWDTCSTYNISTACIPTTTYSYSTSGMISGLSTSQIGTISSINTSQFTINLPEEWVNCLPDFDRIEKMCKEYPGLAIAFEKFKTVYKLVKDDYDTPKNKRPKP